MEVWLPHPRKYTDLTEWLRSVKGVLRQDYFSKLIRYEKDQENQRQTSNQEDAPEDSRYTGKHCTVHPARPTEEGLGLFEGGLIREGLG